MNYSLLVLRGKECREQAALIARGCGCNGDKYLATGLASGSGLQFLLPVLFAFLKKLQLMP